MQNQRVNSHAEKQRRFLEIDGLRAVAISLVLLFHYEKEFFPRHGLFSFGWSGVDLFFVISGFVLYYQVKTRYRRDGKTSYLQYLQNRALRIVPAYYVSLLLTVLFFGREKLLSGTFLMHLGFLHIFDYDAGMSIQPLYWTLAVEVQFYLFLILMAPVLTEKHGMRWLLGLIGMTILYRLALPVFASPSSHTGLILGNILPGRIGEFSCGMIIARIFTERGELMNALRRPEIAGAIGILAFAVLAGCWLVWHTMGDSFLDFWLTNALFYPLVGTGYGLLFLSGMTIPLFKRILSWRIAVFAGTISYSIYLWHVFSLMLLNGLLGGIAGFLISALVTLVISTTSYYLIEKTFLKMKVS